MGEEARPAGAAQLRRIARPGREEAEQVRVKTGRRAVFLKQKRPLVRAGLRHQMAGVFQRGPSASRRGTKQGRRQDERASDAVFHGSPVPPVIPL